MSNLSRMVTSVDKIREVQRAKGPAAILAIATANPAKCINQADYPDFYFRVTDSEHSNKDLKDKFKRICEKSTIKKRYFTLTEEILKENPNITSYGAPSLNIRQDLLIEEVPKLGMEVAKKAIKEWGKPISEITHLIFYTTSGLDMPGADFQLCKLLGLEYHSINRLMLYNNGCYAGGTLLRVAKDIAENNAGARILVVCVENMTIAFHSPCATHKDILVGQALFGDGAVALVIGADPNIEIEHPLFQLIHASQKTIPGSQNEIRGQLREMGLSYYLSPKVPMSISNNIEECLVEALKGSIGCDNIKDWNNLFYAIHPGGPTIINKIEEKLGLEKKKLRATRQVLSDYGNMWSPAVLYVLDEMRKISAKEGKSTNGEGLDWGFAVGFGPGLTIETVVLRALPTSLFV